MGVPYELALGGGKLHILLSRLAHKIRYAWNCNRHSHADYELHIILRSNCVMDVEDNRYPLQQMQAILIPPGLYHYPTPSEDTFERLSVPFSPAEGPLKKQLEAQIHGVRIFSVTEDIADICTEIFGESEHSGPFQQDMLRSLLTKLMISVFRILELTDTQTSVKAGTASVISQQIDDFFEVHLSSGITAETLASELHLSRRQLARILTQTYGMGFREKLIRTRMDRATWLLRSTEKSIQEIAFEVGYCSDAAFFAIFKSHVGETPSVYRENCRRNME